MLCKRLDCYSTVIVVNTLQIFGPHTLFKNRGRHCKCCGLVAVGMVITTDQHYLIFVTVAEDPFSLNCIQFCVGVIIDNKYNKTSYCTLVDFLKTDLYIP